MLKEQIDYIAKEFIPHSAQYCIEDMTTAILSAITECLPDKQANEEVSEYNSGYNTCLKEVKEKLR